MFGKKEKETGSDKVQQAVKKAASYEITVADLARRSERRAWTVATCSLLMSLMLAGGYYYVLPLKEKVPFLIMADAYTGTATVARLVGNFQNHNITLNEAVNRSNVTQYVIARESYDYAITGLRDWRQVFVMSSPDAAADYRHLYSNNNPEDPRRVYGKDKAIRIKILSLTPLKPGRNGSFRGAAVRIQRDVYNKESGTSEFLDNKYITLEFDYDKSMKLDEQDRVLNPLGFQVTAYRVDNDYGTSVPVVNPAKPSSPETNSPVPPVAMPGMAQPAGGGGGDDSIPAIGADIASPREVQEQPTPQISIGNTNGASGR